MKENWEEIRANWVNGNLQDARDSLINNNSKTDLCLIIEDVLRQHLSEIPNGVTRSGDLQDLFEILRSYRSINY